MVYFSDHKLLLLHVLFRMSFLLSYAFCYKIPFILCFLFNTFNVS